MKLGIVSNSNIYLYILYITLHLIYIALFSSLQASNATQVRTG